MKNIVDQSFVFRSISSLCLVALVLLFSQCTIQKRVYQKGWYIDVHHRTKSIDTPTIEKQIAFQSVHDSLPTNTTIYETASPIAQQSIAVNVLDTLMDVEEEQALGVTNNPISIEKESRLLKHHMKDEEPEKKNSQQQVRRNAGIITVVFLLLLALLIYIIVITAVLSDPLFFLAILGVVLLLVAYAIALIVNVGITTTKEKQAEPSEKPKEKRVLLSEEESLESKITMKRRAIIFSVFLSLVFFLGALFLGPIGEFTALLLLGLFCLFIALIVWTKVWSKKPLYKKESIEEVNAPENTDEKVNVDLTNSDANLDKKRSAKIKATIFFGVLIAAVTTFLILKP